MVSWARAGTRRLLGPRPSPVPVCASGNGSFLLWQETANLEERPGALPLRGSFPVRSLWSKPETQPFQVTANYQNIFRDAFCCRARARLFPPSAEMPLKARLGRKTQGYYTRLWLQPLQQPGDSGWRGRLEAGATQAWLPRSSEHEVRCETQGQANGKRWTAGRMGHKAGGRLTRPGRPCSRALTFSRLSWGSFLCSPRGGLCYAPPSQVLFQWQEGHEQEGTPRPRGSARGLKEGQKEHICVETKDPLCPSPS